MVPHLTTSLTGPLADLERLVLDKRPDIEHWFRSEWNEHEVPFYTSVDLRNSGFKLAPVDTNLYPGGFNNLNPEFLPLCVQAIQAAVERGQTVTQGALIGRITDFHAKVVEEIRAPFGGQILYVIGTPPISKGEPVAMVGSIAEK